ncbi:PepSY-like domain-containing protein [Flavobacterium cellulosilyticum]|uniref:Putative beta-lactamase-inhibitor-like PepSY-like domain-containing protein n=1 Tax=Flavobacterium cellulosilyticum TaxID=2541731 RepID=A0A4R5CFE7_9FLAO|nr:PepSY-like domain-containing protein [Flavobacterium cellulosilyticum]TDD95952.1 hypothetical protein E0F76_12645 [Flavobacterium cellulosilyticum]
MKKVFLVVAIVFSATLLAQSEENSKKIVVPTDVKAAFSKEFPNNIAKWGMEDGGYEAEFKIKGSDASAVYDKKGHRKVLEIAIKTAELPVNVLEYLKKNYASNKITEAAKITDDKNTVTYEAEIGKDGKSYDVLFNFNGKFIKIVEGD